MPIYHSKPAEIQAWLYDGSERTRDFLLDMLGDDGTLDVGVHHEHLMIKTNNGWVELLGGHYLMKGVSDFYPCDPVTFAARWVEGPVSA